MKDKIRQHQGFTIIEVVIVLAIAGLIFAIVFIAVPQLQQGQRDSARESEMGRFESAITQYQSHNNGQLPSISVVNGAFVSEYMNGDFSDPVGGNFTAQASGTPGYENAVVVYSTGQTCGGSGGPRNYVVRYELEQGGVQCRDNS